MEEPLEDIENQFNCGICMDIFFDPVSLPCGHSYCFSCLHTYMINGGPKKCPACRDIWDVWPKTNLVLNEFLQKAFPVRWRRGLREKEELRDEKRRLLEIQMAEARQNRTSILKGEGGVLIIAVIVLFLILWREYTFQYF